MTDKHQELIAAYLNGENVAEELLEACRQDQSLLERLAQLCAVERLISHHCNNDGVDAFVDEINRRLIQRNDPQFADAVVSKITPWRKYRTSNGILFFSVCAAILLLLFSLVMWFVNSTSDVELARVSNVASALNLDVSINENEIIKEGKFNITSGYAEVELNSGVKLLVEGPTLLDVKSKDHVLLSTGSVVAKVPKGNQDFVLSTPNTEIKSGEEYGVSVSKHGVSQVHALKGQVKTRFINQKDFELVQEHQAMAFDVNHQVEIIQNNPEKFMRSLPGKSSKSPEYLHWSFDELIDGVYQCRGKGIDGKCYNASVHHIDNTNITNYVINGQYGKGVYIDGANTWLQTNFQGIGGNNPRTVSFWLKVPKDFTPKNGYGVLSWGLSTTQSAWQISPNPQINDGPLGRIRVGTNKAQIIGSTDIRDERWHHVSVVLFGGVNTNLSTHVLIYIDGELEQSSDKSIANVYTQLSHPKSKPLMMGRNIAYTNPKYKFKFFKGWIDEVFIFNAALSQQQIQHLMKHNTIDNNS